MTCVLEVAEECGQMKVQNEAGDGNERCEGRVERGWRKDCDVAAFIADERGGVMRAFTIGLQKHMLQYFSGVRSCIRSAYRVYVVESRHRPPRHEVPCPTRRIPGS